MPTEQTRVFIAGPYSHPDPCQNTHAAMFTWDWLLSTGYCPFCPHWTHFQHTFRPRPYKEWLKWDEVWIQFCHVVLRLHGASAGADAEVVLAKELGIPVTYSIQELFENYPPTREVTK